MFLSKKILINNASSKGYTDIISLFLDIDSSLVSVPDSVGMTSVHYCINGIGNISTLELLLNVLESICILYNPLYIKIQLYDLFIL